MNIQSDSFRLNITQSLTNAYIEAFQRSFTVFVNQKTRLHKTLRLNNQVKINLVNITNTGKTNAQNTKYLVSLRYFVQNNNRLVQAEFASDSINLLSGQEMAQYLGQEVLEQGYSEAKPIKSIVQDNRLWIIAAVIVPVAFLIVTFWIVAFIYFKCINPTKHSRKPRARRLTESPSSVISKLFSHF